MDYSPKNYSSKLNTIDEVLDVANDLEKMDFSSIIDRDIEGSDDLAAQASKELSSTLKGFNTNIGEVKNEVFSDVSDDFENRLSFYRVLAINGIEEDTFPFGEWFSCLDDTKEKVNFLTSDSILKSIQDIKLVNEELANSNLVEYLSSVKSRLDYPNKFLLDLNKFINENYKGLNLLNVLSASSYSDLYSALKGKDVIANKDSTLLFQYASTILKDNWSEKSLIEFKDSDLYRKINDKNLMPEFLKELLIPRAGKTPLFIQKNSYFNSRYRVESINWDNCKEFVNHVLKEDVKTTEFFVEKLISFFDKKKQEELSVNAVELINTSMYHQLNKEVPLKEKMKKGTSKI
jgi:hypothetical protein